MADFRKWFMLIAVFSLLFACLASAAPAQTPTPTPAPDVSTLALPDYVAAGLAWNQTASTRINAWASGLWLVSTPVRGYTSTTSDIFPVKKVVDGKTVYVVQFQVRQGFHRDMWQSPNGKAHVLLGGDIGGAFSQAQPSGVNVNLAAAVTITGVYQFNPHWGVIVPMRGIYTASLGGWVPIVQAGVVYTINRGK